MADLFMQQLAESMRLSGRDVRTVEQIQGDHAKRIQDLEQAQHAPSSTPMQQPDLSVAGITQPRAMVVVNRWYKYGSTAYPGGAAGVDFKAQADEPTGVSEPFRLLGIAWLPMVTAAGPDLIIVSYLQKDVTIVNKYASSTTDTDPAGMAEAESVADGTLDPGAVWKPWLQWDAENGKLVAVMYQECPDL